MRAGESLYLPAGWWHHVRQSDSNEITVALNWWYDIEMQGMAWVMLSFLRGAGHLPTAIIEKDEKEDKIIRNKNNVNNVSSKKPVQRRQ